MEPEGPGDDPTFQDFEFDGGEIYQFRNLGSTFNFGSNSVFVNSGGGLLRQVAVVTQNRDLFFSGGIWTGSGELTFSNPLASDTPNADKIPTFRFLADTNLSGFTGTLTVIGKAILELEEEITNPSFALNLTEDGRYDNLGDHDIAVRALIIDGTALPPGAYQVGNGSLSASQETFFLTSGKVTVVPPLVAGDLLDTNSNGIHDVLEIANPGVDFSNPTLDSDGDGFTDLDETLSNTDPTNPQSFITCEVRATTPTSVTVAFPGSEGIRYQLQWSPDLFGWVNFGEPQQGVNGDNTLTMTFTELTLPSEPSKLFFRLGVLNTIFENDGIDSDIDGLINAEESFTLMFDPSVADSMRALSNGGDDEHLRELLRGVNLNESTTDTSYAASISPENAARFLFQAGFGASDSDIAAVLEVGFEGWIDAQLATPRYLSYEDFALDQAAQYQAAIAANGGNLPERRRVPYRPLVLGHPQENLSTAFMRSIVHGDDVLRQKSSWALMQILVASGAGYSPRYARPCGVYIDLIHDRCFGKYKDLLYHVSLNGHMGDWLSHINNKKANPSLGTLPDENYAREIMQLFSIGLFQMHPDGSYLTDGSGALIPTYDFDDVAELARTFTGLKGTANGTAASDTVNWNFTSREMIAQESDHDRGSKTLLYNRTTGNHDYLNIPANMDVKDEVRLGVDALVAHPNCAPFVATRLIQNMVTSNPTAAYVERISTVFTNTDGDLGQVIKAILLDPEARGPRFLTDPLHGKLREPMMRFTSLMKAFEVGTEYNSDPYTDSTEPQGSNFQFYTGRTIGKQAFFESPSVFNFFSSDYQEPGEVQQDGLVAPEFQLLNATTNISFINEIHNTRQKSVA